MNELLKGRISDTEGLKEVLELIATFNEVSTAILNIESEGLSGRIGVAWGKFITGALIDEPAEKGKKALRHLLRLRQGKFVFLDLEDELPNADLRQALGIDLLRTITVVPELDPKEAHFLWGADESPEQDAVQAKAYIAVAEPVPDEPEWIEPEEVEKIEPEVTVVSEFAPPDSEPILPNFEQMFAAVARESNSSDNLPVPDISEEELATAYEIRRLPPKPGFEATPALDAIFGAPIPEAIAHYDESAPPKNFNRPSTNTGRYPAADVEAVDAGSAAAEPWLPPTPAPAPTPPPERVSRPMLQPNTVADPNFVGQRFVDPPSGLRPAPATDSGKIGTAIFCVILFVVSCASTVLLGPRAWEFITSVLHH